MKYKVLKGLRARAQHTRVCTWEKTLANTRSKVPIIRHVFVVLHGEPFLLGFQVLLEWPTPEHAALELQAADKADSQRAFPLTLLEVHAVQPFE